MAPGLDDLTQKEKQTLRLIVRGHDAKSAARELQLSVHTINERLRHARRKLDVTSSREAARLLLESEQEPHEKPVYEPLGDAVALTSRDDHSIALGHMSAYWIGGVLIMSLFALALSLTISGASPAQSPDSEGITAELAPTQVSSADSAREDAARQWLALVDQSDWQASFKSTSKTFQELNTLAMWRDASLQARVPYGGVAEREAIGFSVVNAPPKGFVEVRFLTVFEGGKTAIERVTLEPEEGVLKVVGYVIE